MTEYNCPVCGTLVGTSIVGTKPSYYHCGRRFPSSPSELPEPALIANDPSLSASDKETRLAKMLRSLQDARRSNDVQYGMVTHQVQKYLKNIRNIRDGQAVIAHVKGPAKLSRNPERKELIACWHLLLSGDAHQRGVKPPEKATHDNCVRYAKEHDLELPEWAL